MTTDDLRIRDIRPLSPPIQVIGELPATSMITETVLTGRREFSDLLAGRGDRLAVVVGPCSIHDPAAAIDYARRLAAERQRLADDLAIVMRVYFEKPRTTVGWKGLINDPGLDGGFDIDAGLRTARRLLLEINALGLPAACEFLDVTTPQYFADLVAWGAIGARTTESQIHREMASGLSCPVGFKNGTDGQVRVAVDAVLAASQPHHFLAVGKDGRSAIAATTGNGDCHNVLRGGRDGPNYDAASVAAACAQLEAAELAPRLMVDASHDNARKDHANQPKVCADLAGQVAAGDRRIFAVMVESNLAAGRQALVPGRPLAYGQSITDPCIDWETTVAVLEGLAGAVRARRQVATRPAEAALA